MTNKDELRKKGAQLDVDFNNLYDKHSLLLTSKELRTALGFSFCSRICKDASSGVESGDDLDLLIHVCHSFQRTLPFFHPVEKPKREKQISEVDRHAELLNGEFTELWTKYSDIFHPELFSSVMMLILCRGFYHHAMAHSKEGALAHLHSIFKSSMENIDTPGIDSETKTGENKWKHPTL